MSFYQQSGVLVFGSRLRRLSEAFLADVNLIYRQHHISFDAAWFPIFYMLSSKEALSIREIAEALEISHSAASQQVSKLKEKGLLKSVVDTSDTRKKTVAFTAKGHKLLAQVKPVWAALQKAMEDVQQESLQGDQLIPALTAIESSLQNNSLYNRIEKHL